MIYKTKYPTRHVRTAMLVAALALGGCAASPSKNPADPLESFNRSVYKFNDTLDKAVAKPVSRGYQKVMPRVGQIMVTNFFSNLDDVVVTFNDLLQLKFAQAASDGTRVLFNSTFGVFGLIEVTTRLPKHHEDFGQTLGYWGIAPGPYLMLPILGPSTLRDGAGRLVDTQPSQMGSIKHVPTRNQLYLLNGVSYRAELLEQEKLLDEAALDRYTFIRDSYLQRRQSLVYDGHPPREKYEDEGEDEELPPASPTSD